ncbi:MAG: hypothetical protein R2747_17215 [Pyrinomonadaceae bacterium]
MKIDFSAIDWETSPLGSRFKAIETGRQQRVRLVEINRADGEAEWCRNGHVGYVIEGELEIEFRDRKIVFRKGDGILIAAGPDEEHKPRPISQKVLLFLVESTESGSDRVFR